MKTKIPVYAAIIAAVTFFLYSVIQLIGYGLSNGVINENSVGSLGSLIQFLFSNFSNLVKILITILIVSTSAIYAFFILYTKKASSKFLKISSFALLIVNFLAWFLILLAYLAPSAYSSINISVNSAEAFLGIVGIFFGISLIMLKKLKSPLLVSLGILFILQGVSLFASLFLPIRIVDFTIAMNVVEAVFFSKLAEEHK